MQRLVLPALALPVLAFLVAACGGGGEEKPAVPFAQACQKSDEKQFSEAPPRIIDTDRTYVATISTEKGDIVLELFSDVSTTTNNFVFLACKGFYDGLIFHRVAADPPVIQGGDPAGTGMGGPGYSIPGEFEGATFDAGVLGMARGTDPDSGGSQFFITLDAAHFLDGQYAAFGRVTAGMDVAQQIAIGDVIQAITIEEQ